MRIAFRPATVLFAAASMLLAVRPAGAHDNDDEPKFRLLKPHKQEGNKDFAISTLSARNDVVSGGDVLARVDVASSIALGDVRVELNGIDVTSAFQPVPGSHALIGLVTGLANGDHVLSASEAGRKGKGKGPSGRLRVTNWPITGPIFSTTTTFNLPTTGGNLGPALDADCSAATRIDYVYKPTGSNAFRPLTVNGVLPASAPSDVDKLPNSAVRYIVRVETGTVNRG